MIGQYVARTGVLAALGALVTGAAVQADEAALFPEVGAVQKVCTPTHIGFFGDVTTVTLKFGGIVYRLGQGPWTKVPVELNGPHSIARLPNGRWLINDTDNHRMVEIERLDGKGKTIVRAELGGQPLKRPHDQIVDPDTGNIYVIDGNRRLYRFKSLDGPADVWQFTPEEMGYSRSLSWFDGRLHVVLSSRGEVLRIDDFDRKRSTRFRSPRPKDARGRSTQIDAKESRSDFDAGALASTGLVFNDVDKGGDWYYATNFFTPSHASGADTSPARLIRWRTWADFERGAWEDLSNRIPKADVPLVPYYITVHDGKLYTPLFIHHDTPPPLSVDPCKDDRLFALELAQTKPQRTGLVTGAPNFRDLGGYKTADGKTVKWGQVYRSDALSDMTEADLQTLATLNIGKVVDFRAAEEIAGPNADKLPPGGRITQVNLPVATKSTPGRSPWADVKGENAQLAALDTYLLEDMYPSFVRDNTPAYRAWMQGLLDTPGKAQVFHCRGGADRTGFAAAMFLVALGVPRETVIQDYLITNSTIFAPEGRPYLDQRMPAKLPQGMQLHARHLEAAFAQAEKQYGSLDNYLRDALGVDDTFRRKLRARYLE